MTNEEKLTELLMKIITAYLSGQTTKLAEAIAEAQWFFNKKD